MIRIDEALLGIIDQNQGDLLEILARLVRFDTRNPPGGNELEAQNWIGARLEQMGLEVDLFDVYPGRPDVVGILRGTGEGRSIILNGHIDVCPVRSSEDWSHDPFAPVIEAGRMYGRGTSDMKGALAGFLCVLECILRRGYRPRGDIIFQSVVDEEIGGPGTRRCIERGYLADFAIVGEHSRGRRIHASIGLMNACITVRGPYTLKLRDRARFQNLSGRLEGANCIGKVATKIVPALDDLERHWAVFKLHPLVPDGLALINPFLVEGGGNWYFVPDECRLYVTVTYLPNEKKEEVQAEIEAQIRKAADLDPWLAIHPPRVQWGPPSHETEFAAADLDVDHPGVRLLAEANEAITGEVPLIGGRGGLTDAGWFYQAGIPAVIFGPGTGEVVHQADEFVDLGDLMTFTKTVMLFLLNWCDLNQEG